MCIFLASLFRLKGTGSRIIFILYPPATIISNCLKERAERNGKIVNSFVLFEDDLTRKKMAENILLQLRKKVLFRFRFRIPELLTFIFRQRFQSVTVILSAYNVISKDIVIDIDIQKIFCKKKKIF